MRLKACRTLQHSTMHLEYQEPCSYSSPHSPHLISSPPPTHHHERSGRRHRGGRRQQEMRSFDEISRNVRKIPFPGNSGGGESQDSKLIIHSASRVPHMLIKWLLNLNLDTKRQ
ncbi:unnamed protein product [Merluccius merluccius]